MTREPSSNRPDRRGRLRAMMFLEYAVWGAWAPVLWPYLTGELGLSQTQAGWIFSALWIACMVAPMAAGQAVDRWLRTERVVGGAHLAGGVVLLVLAFWPTRGEAAFGPWFGLMLLYSLFYAPTLALTNSLALRHLDGDAEFGGIRVFGTLGWIASGFILTLARTLFSSRLGAVCDSLALAGVLSLLLGGLAFTLPRTPPARDPGDPFAFRRALVLLRDKNTLAFLLIAFVVTTELQFYYGPTASFLEQSVGVAHASVPLTMSVAQVAEVVAMAAVLPVALRRLGLAKTLALGALAWPIRYAVFALAPLAPVAVMRPVVIASLALHGIGFTFFFVGSQVFIDRASPPDIRASAQALLTLVTLGLGNFLGTLFTARVLDHFSHAGTTDWTPVFLVPCALTVLSAVAFLALVRDPSKAAIPDGP